jgi:DNA primase
LIPKDTIAKIFDTAQIEEVVSDYVQLKKRGANYTGLCPFHDDKSPSMSVSPARGIYKCFSCGASGNAVNFVMEYDKITYPEALKVLAKKYGIDVVEAEQTQEQIEAQNERESMLLVTEFASETFHKQLLNSDEGKSVGLSYLKNRGISDEMIDLFQLGYSPEKRDFLTDYAQEKGYQKEFLEKVGLTITKNSSFDRFQGRVIFPIHSISGRTIGFGGRTLSSEKKIAKYLNSPESDIYHKSKVLYGLFQSKRFIAKEDECLLVEGYTDVISFHQKGVQNVVSSSGTALTPDQIKLIRRFTPNITLALDGDAAGQKAAIRGVDLILKEGMNVKVVAFPEGEDPDSFARANSTVYLKEYLQENAQDFIGFKCQLLLEEAGNDPIKRAELIKDVVASIGLIPDAITRNVYIQEASKTLSIEERIILAEVNKSRNKNNYQREEPPLPDLPPDIEERLAQNIPPAAEEKIELQKVHPRNEFNEGNIIRLLILYGHHPLFFKVMDESGNPEDVEISVAEFILGNIEEDQIQFEIEIFQKIYNEILEHLDNKEALLTEKHFFQHEDQSIVRKVIEITSEKYVLSDRWKDHSIFVTTELDNLKRAVEISINRLKLDKVKNEILSLQKKLEAQPENEDELLLEYSRMIKAKQALSKILGRTI